MGIFKKHTLFGKVGTWLNKSKIGKAVNVVGKVAVGAASLLGGFKIGSMAVAAIKSRVIKEDKIVETLVKENIPATKSAIKEVKNAINDQVKNDTGLTLEAVKTVFKPEKSKDILGFLKDNLVWVLSGAGVLVLGIAMLIFKPFQKKRRRY
jgi:hypothetical protein